MRRQKKANSVANNDESEKNANFIWTDDEIELLLGVIIHFKAQKEAEGYDWETVKTKYESLTELFVKSYPKTTSDKFPKTNIEGEFTKARILTKVKSIRLKYRKAVDAGKRSGGGRVVATFYDSCENIWGGSPAAEMINGGLESSEKSPEQPLAAESQSEPEEKEVEEDQDNEIEDGVGQDAQITNPNKRRNLVEHVLNQRDAKLRKKIPMEKVMLDVAKEDVELKKEYFIEMKKADKEQCDQLRVLNETMVNLTKSINEGIRVLTQMTPAVMHNRQLPAVYPTKPMIDQSTHGQNVALMQAMQQQANTYNFYTDS